MEVDRHLARSIVACNGHRWTRFTTHCVRQCLSIDNITSLLTPTIYISIYTFHNLLSQTRYIDRSPPLPIVEATYYCCVHCPECGHEHINHTYAHTNTRRTHTHTIRTMHTHADAHDTHIQHTKYIHYAHQTQTNNNAYWYTSHVHAHAHKH